jgi:alkylated DNA repair dioxygenase AlkB
MRHLQQKETSMMPARSSGRTCADLFATAPYRTVIADAEGGVRYWPQLVGMAQAEDWFTRLRDGIAWQTMQRPMYERIVDVPRMLARFDLDALPADLPLAEMLAAVREVMPGRYTSVGLNLYRDGRDSVAPHNDHIDELMEGEPIALLSLGATRRMTLRERDAPKRSFDIDMEPGSVLTMSYATQFHYDHGIPKMRGKVGPRISLAFRVRPEGKAASRRYGSRKKDS